MERKDTFGVHFVLRRMPAGKCYVYARIVVNKSKCELGMKQAMNPSDWNGLKGCAKGKSDELRRFNSYLEEVRGKLVRHYQQ